MNREALDRLVLARNVGWSYDKLAALYMIMKAQIENAVPGWRAQSERCVDGSYAFIGSKGPVLVIMPDCRMFVGRFGELVSWVGLQPQANGTFAFPAPNTAARGTREY